MEMCESRSRVRASGELLGLALLACALGCGPIGPRFYRVPSGAMAPTVMAGDRVFVMRLPAKKFKIARGDVIVLLAPDQGDDLVLKRVIALEGDLVEVRNQ